MGRARVYLPRNCHHYFYEWEGAVMEYVAILYLLAIATITAGAVGFLGYIVYLALRGD